MNLRAPRRRATKSVGAQLLESTARVTSVLRCVLLVPLAVLAGIVHDLESDGLAYLLVLAAFAVWTAVTTAWAFARPTPHWVGPASIFVDLAFFIAMALGSAGVTSYITPVFYLYPLFTVFFSRPWITGVVGVLVAGGYAAVWLDNLAVRGGPGHSGVVWMHFLLLVWMAASTTALSLVLAHRARVDAAARAAHDHVTAQLLAADLRASTRVADELHDGPLQNVIAVRRMLEALTDDGVTTERVLAADGVLAQTADALRGTVGALHPQVLRQLGLDAALREMARESSLGGVPVTTNIEAVAPLTDEQEFVLFAAARELLSNARRHSGAEGITMSLRESGSTVQLTVGDDGAGMPTDGPTSGDLLRSGHIGLASHTLRVESIDGSLTHRPRSGGGTVALVQIPISLPTRKVVPSGGTWPNG